MAQGGNLTDFAALELLDHALGTGSWTMPTQCYLALFDIDPTDDMASGTEHSGNGYARQAINFGAAAARAASNSDAQVYTASGGDWGSTLGWAIFDASSGGNAIYHGEFDEAEIINDGNTFTVGIGDLDIDFAVGT